MEGFSEKYAKIYRAAYGLHERHYAAKTDVDWETYAEDVLGQDGLDPAREPRAEFLGELVLAVEREIKRRAAGIGAAA